MKFEMTRERALELGLLICTCGHPENNHFDHGEHGCARCDKCQGYQEVGIKGLKVIKK